MQSGISSLRFPPPWDAATGVDLEQLEVLIHGLGGFSAVTLTQPAAISVLIAGDN